MIEISVRGKWTQVPSFTFRGKTIMVLGKWLKTARVHDEPWLASELDDPEGCTCELRRQGLGADLLTFAQMPPVRPQEYTYHAESDSIAVCPVKDFEAWWSSLPQETRKNARRAERRGVRVEIRPFDDELVHQIVGLNNSSSVRQGRRYTHFGKSFDEVKKDHLSFLDRSEFICAYFENTLIGYIKLVYRGRIASILNILSDEEHSDKRPANALIKVAAERCSRNNIELMTYGYFNYGNKRDTTITQFKVRHGFEEALVPRYWIPLTPWGRLALSLGLHRGLLGILPNSVLTKAVALRAKWYTTSKRIASRCSSMLERSNSTRQMGRSTPPAGSNS